MFYKNDIYDYQEHRQYKGVKRATANIIVSLSADSSSITSAIREELGGLEFSAIYILIDRTSKRSYIGETSDVFNRIKNHLDKPINGMSNWDFGIVIWDGRPNTTSAFNEATLRKSIEASLINLVKLCEYAPINKQEKSPALTYSLKLKSSSLFEEIIFTLRKIGLINFEPPAEVNADILSVDEILNTLDGNIIPASLKKNKFHFFVDGKKTYYRHGSIKKKGIQVTLDHSSLEAIRDNIEEGYILFARGVGYLIPINILHKHFGAACKGRHTYDIYIKIEHAGVFLNTGKSTIDITEFSLPLVKNKFSVKQI